MSFDEELSEYELLQAKNIKELEEFMSEVCTPGIGDAIQAINTFRSVPARSERKKWKKRDDDQTYRFTGSLPLQMRKSARLSNSTPQYTYLDLPDEEVSKRVNYDDVDGLEAVVFRKKRASIRRSLTVPNSYEFVPVEAITPQYLSSIAMRNIGKVYSQDGTSCHQCRQKTTDSKTYCRSGRCIGVRGQFCGICLKNRYGEDAWVALMDPEWECPPCRGLCNCSICRAREGKRPTGILAPVAFRHGHKSVKDFLISLKGFGDYEDNSNPNKKRQVYYAGCTNCDHISLLGFDKDFRPISMIDYDDGLCSKEYDLIGFNTELKPIVADGSEPEAQY